MQHPALRMRDIEAPFGSCHRNVHQTPFLLHALVFVPAVLVRE